MKIFINCIKNYCHGRFKNEKTCNRGRSNSNRLRNPRSDCCSCRFLCSEFCQRHRLEMMRQAKWFSDSYQSVCLCLSDFLSTLGLVGGIGLLAYKPWARYLVIVVSALGCLNIPIGTLKGVYSLWVLLQDETLNYSKQK